MIIVYEFTFCRISEWGVIKMGLETGKLQRVLTCSKGGLNEMEEDSFK